MRSARSRPPGNDRQRLMAVINSLADAVITLDRSGDVVLYNGAALDLLDTNIDLAGRPIDRLLKLQDSSEQTVKISDLMERTKTSLRRDDLVYRAAGDWRLNLDLTLSPVRTYSQTEEAEDGFILVLRDITDAKTLEQQREEFLSVVTHELRTPLAIAEADISTALMPGFGRIDAKSRVLLEQGYKNIVFMSELIRDLTALARAEQGALSVDIKLVEPAALLEQLAADYRAEAEAKGLELEVSAKPKLAPMLTSEYRVHEILQNFITNAIKYTEQGSVSLAVRPADGARNSVVFSVTDTGVGISARDQKHLFTKFYRSDDPRVRHATGTGLGLYITSKLAEKLGAKIWYNSALGRGSTFYLQVSATELTEEQKRMVAKLSPQLSPH